MSPLRLTAEQRRDRAMSENDLLSVVVATARYGRWLIYHVRNSKAGVIQGDDGFPDVIAASASGRLLVAELKAQLKDPTPNQERWLDRFRQTAAEVYVWRPSDWHDGSIGRVFGVELPKATTTTGVIR